MTKLNSILESPGVSIQERDASQLTTNSVGTNIFIPGFTPQGPSDEPMNVSSITEFEEIFGLPVTPAEKYSHNAVKQILTTSNAQVTFTRMPYGSGGGLGYSDLINALVFPIIGLSAVEKDVCEYYRNVDEETCRVDFPWLYNTEYFVSSALCYGSSNMECSLDSLDEDPGYLYIHNHPFEYDSIMTGFKFVMDSDSTSEDLRIFQLRPNTAGTSTTYSVVTSLNLSSIYANLDEDQSNLSQDSKRLLVNIADSPYKTSYTISKGLLSGRAVSGIQVSAGDVFGSYSLAANSVLKYFNVNADIAASFKTTLTTLSTISAGATFSVTTTALDAATTDFLISFCGVPVEAGLSCQTITALGLTVPEEDRYTFYPVPGDAQLNDANFYVLGEPISRTLNASEYQLLENEQFNWKCGAYANAEANLDVTSNDIRGGIVVINKLKTAQLEDFTGYYVALNDNLNVNPATNFDDLTGVAGYYNDICPGVSGNWVDVPSDRWNFKVSETFDGTAGSITELVHQNAGVEFGNHQYKDSLIMSLFKLRPTRLTETISKLDQVRVEQFIGSLDVDRKIADSNGGAARSYFLESTVNNSSNYLKVLVNPYLSKNNCWTDSSGNPQKTVRMFREKTSGVFSNFNAEATLRAYSDKLYGAGSYNGFCRDALYDMCRRKDIGNLPAKLERALNHVENPIEFPIDITIDNGLSTMWATRQAVKSDACVTDTSICYNYDDTYYVNTDSLSPYNGTVMSSSLQDAWEVIYNIFDSFARFTRKSAGGTPHVHIQDPLRQIFVNGKDYKIVQRQKQMTLDPVTNQPTEKYATFGRNIYSYLRNLYQGINSSYSISYANWIKSYDTNTDSYTWFGTSPFAAALYAKNDRDQYPWTSPLGTSNGIFSNVNDLAINPNQRERDLIARIGLNPIVRESAGTFAYNSTTLLKESSALKEISIRRGALWLAKSIQGNLSQFIGLPNNIVTRTRIVNILRPILEYMKDNGGLYDYMIVCDERNNNAASIDQGVLNVAVYIKPTRPVKFILVDLVITGTGVDFNELI